MSFYQIVDFSENLNKIIETFTKIKHPFELISNQHRILLLQIIDHDYSILESQSIKSLLLNNNDFFRIINGNCYVRDIDFIEKIDDDVKYELLDELLDKNFDGFKSEIEKQKLHIKQVDLFDENKRIIVIYDSGVIFTPRDLNDSLKQSLENLLFLMWR
uniref:Uncharacterized protein n=1 Tax=viral metagenome TaxID=1070528 RepID=A0A6M3X5H3_9ZZZZ